MRESWRPIPGYRDRYEVSTLGAVRSWNGESGFHEKGALTPRAEKPKLLNPVFRRRRRIWELVVTLSGGDTGVPRKVRVKDLVRDVWMEGPKKGYVVSHRNGDQKDCSLHNLYYTTQTEVNRKRSCAHRKPVVARDVATGKVLEIYPSIDIAGKKNFVGRAGMGKRIYRKTVVDGVIFEFDEGGEL